MKTNWKNWNTGNNAKLHKLESGQVWAVFTNASGFGVGDKTFASTITAKEFFTIENGWH